MTCHKNNPERISNVPLRQPYLQSGMGPSEIARELGKIDRTTGKMDTTGLQRMLGLRGSPPSFKRGKMYPEGKWYAPSYTSTIRIDKAKALCVVLGVDFDELYDGWLPEQKPAALCKTCGNPMLRRHVSRECGLCLLEREDLGRLDYVVAA